MSEATLTLRELFEVDPEELSAHIESGMDAYQLAQNARKQIAKESRAIQWPWVRKVVAEKSRGILDLNVIDIVLDAWKKYMEIQQYADPQKNPRGEAALVPMAAHTVESRHHPYVQILLKESEIARITFDLDFSLRLEAFVLKIQDGRICEIQTGSGTGQGSLSLADVTLWKTDSKPLRFPGHISLGDGIPLPLASTAAGPTLK